MQLEDLGFFLNTHVSDEGTKFDAVLDTDQILVVICSSNDEFPIHMTMTDTQLLAVTPLFNRHEVKDDALEELHEIFLRLSPAVPLSSIGLQGDTYILFGAMALSTSLEVVAHELGVQAENTIDVLEVVEHLLQ